MSKNLKFFLASFFISLIFWWGVNVFNQYLQDFFFPLFSQSPEIFSAQVLPVNLLAQKENLEIEAKSALSVKIDKFGNQKILFEKNPDQVLPIASLTKLMTAFVVLENYDLSQEIKISQVAIDQPEDFGQLKLGERLSVENLLYLLLIESSNDASYALADLITPEAFVDLMNIEAKFLDLKNTHFVDPGGWGAQNYSNARDLVKFSQYLLEKKPKIFEITKLSEFDLYNQEGIFHHRLLNTNEILKKYPQIIGGKTGQNPWTEGNLLLVLKSSQNNGYLINVILGSKDRFGEMEKLIDWLAKNYQL